MPWLSYLGPYTRGWILNRAHRRNHTIAALSHARFGVLAVLSMTHGTAVIFDVTSRLHKLTSLFATILVPRSSFYFDFGCHSPRTAPVGSRIKLRLPMPITSVTSFMISAPSDFAFCVAARMSST
jgi:hypothetical protein